MGLDERMPLCDRVEGESAPEPTVHPAKDIRHEVFATGAIPVWRNEVAIADGIGQFLKRPSVVGGYDDDARAGAVSDVDDHGAVDGVDPLAT
jgi:hypothetical protein